MKPAAIAFVLLNAADALLTLWLVGHGHAVEGNPAMAAVLGLGSASFLLVKLAASALVAWACQRYAPRALVTAAWGFAVVVAWNVFLALAVHSL